MRARALLVIMLVLLGTAAMADVPAGQEDSIDPWAQADTHRLGVAAGVRQFRDWTLACDNLGGCTAISLSGARAARIARSDPGDHALPLLSVERSGARDAWRVTVDYRQLDYAPSLAGLQLHVMRDGVAQIGPGFPLTQVTPGHYALDAEAVDQFLTDSRRSRRAAVSMQGHGIHGIVSTAGLSASLAAIDARQRQASMAMMTGAYRLQVFNPVRIDDEEARQLHRLGCNMGMPPAGGAIIGAVDPDGTRLTGQLCGDTSHAWRVWLVQRGDYLPAPVEFPTPDEARGTVIEGGLPMSQFNLDNGEMIALRPARPRGDCGWQRRWRWTPMGFELAETRIMPFCVGLAPASWPVIYRSP